MILHVDFFVSSMERSLDFYVNKLNMKIVEDIVIKGDLVKFVSNNRYNEYRLVLLQVSSKGAMIELMEYKKKNDEPKINIIPHQGSTTLFVNCLEKKIDELKQKGLFPISEIYTISSPKFGKSRITFYKDPDGHIIELLQVLPREQ